MTADLTLAEREAAVARCNQAMDAATAAAPPSKTWVRQALRRGGAARCPVRLRRLSLDIILRQSDLLADLFRTYPDDAVYVAAYDIFVGFQRPDAPRRVNVVQAMTESMTWTDEWGTAWAHAAGGVGAATVANPLTDWADLDDYLARRMPRPDEPGRLDAVLPTLRQHAASRYVCGMTHLALFERFHCLRGMEQAFEDLLVYPAETERLLDALTDYLLVLIGGWGRLGVDAWFLTEDWGTQLALMISPETWRRYFARRYRRLCEEAHRWKMEVVFHSCGNVTAIVGDLIDAGVDVLDPVQPEAMDLDLLAREFGGRIAFSGGISDQALVAYTPDQVRDHVRRALDTLGHAHGNAYLVGPSNVLPPEIPPRNLVALFEACHE